MNLRVLSFIYCDYAEGVPEVVEAMAQHGDFFIFLPSFWANDIMGF
jgi:hypothetical protein